MVHVAVDYKLFKREGGRSENFVGIYSSTELYRGSNLL